MKALVLTAYKEFELQDMPEPAIGSRDVLVRVAACGICGSDVHGMDGSTGRRRPPIVMGHEASGVIERVGAEVKDYRVGDRVTFDSTIYNPESFFSRRGLINLCDDRRVLGVSCEDYRQHGAFAELVSVPSHILYALPPGHDLRAGRPGRAGLDRGARPQPHPHRAGRHRARVRGRAHRADDGAGAQEHAPSSRSSPSTSTTGKLALAREVGAHPRAQLGQGRRGRARSRT